MKEAPAWRDIAIYNGSSGTAGDEYDRAIAQLKEWEGVMKKVRGFMKKHAETLAGLRWAPAYLEAAVEIQPRYYRCQRVTAEAVARLWPSAKWQRVKAKFYETRINWVAEVDGITLRIEDAERIEVPKIQEGLIDFGKEGQAV